MKPRSKVEELYQGFLTSSVNRVNKSSLAYRSEFLSNDSRQGRKVLVSIEQELQDCEEFRISVAFITKSGITPLLQVLKDLEQKGIPGKILTTDYLSFSEPKALETLNSLDNIELRMYRTNDGDTGDTGGFHTKGYIFQKDEIFKIIIGSSNLTMSAMTTNREWNTKIVATSEGEFVQNVLREFGDLWEDAHTKTYEEFIDNYRLDYYREKNNREQQRQALSEQVIRMDRYMLKPNKMQVSFMASFMNLYSEHKERMLLLSATGTGKTYASAFAMRELAPKRILFLVHREQIAKQSMKSYRRVFGESRSYGLLSGSSKKDNNAEFLFSTMQMMAKPDVYQMFDPNTFDAIIVDECHRAGAPSYQRIMEYFKPQLWLGMTASPDTTQYDIYSLFDHNIAYEIRLQQALEEDLLCPFHYFGITDLEVDGKVFDDHTGVKRFANLVCDDRVRYVVDKAEYFGHSGDRVKGLIFCSLKEEARELSRKFNQIRKKNGTLYRTEVLTGEDTQDRREEVIERLATDDAPDQVDYIFTVDIFNEGVDVPEINQVIMLRPTQSPVVFIQQLGRGLRKTSDKEYVVILDFIGNYMNNFMIPVALSGDLSYNKDTMRRYIREGSRVIPGSSTIHFDEISKHRIYESIDGAKTNDMKLLKDSYQSLKYKLGRIPTIMEFKQYGSIDVTKIFDKCGSYYAFLKKYEKDYKIQLNDKEQTIIEYMSKKLVSYKRPHELALIEYLLFRSDKDSVGYSSFLKDEYGVKMNPETQESVVRCLTNQFPKDQEKKKYQACVLIERLENDSIHLAPEFKEMLQKESFYDMVKDLITFGLLRYKEEYSELYLDTSFRLYQKYTYEDVCRLLNWKRDMNALNIGGYFYDSETKTLPVFINYHKTEDAIAYEDRFESECELIALSKHPRKIDSSDVMHIYKRSERDKENRIFLFVRKNKNDKEAKEFYFLGEMFAEGEPNPIIMEKTQDDAFEIHYRLEHPVRSDIYDYIVKD